MAVTIREVREGDAEQTAALFNLFIEEGKYTILVEPFTVERQLDFIRQMSSSGVFYVAVGEDDITVLGMQVVLPLSDIASLKHVGDIGTYISPVAQRMGLGKALSDATFTRAKDLGYTKLIAMIRGDNPRAQAFYKGIGFNHFGTATRHALVRGEYIDEVLTEKFL